MWDLILSVPDHCLSFYCLFFFVFLFILCGIAWWPFAGKEPFALFYLMPS